MHAILSLLLCSVISNLSSGSPNYFRISQHTDTCLGTFLSRFTMKSPARIFLRESLALDFAQAPAQRRSLLQGQIRAEPRRGPTIKSKSALPTFSIVQLKTCQPCSTCGCCPCLMCGGRRCTVGLRRSKSFHKVVNESQ